MDKRTRNRLAPTIVGQTPIGTHATKGMGIHGGASQDTSHHNADKSRRRPPATEPPHHGNRNGKSAMRGAPPMMHMGAVGEKESNDQHVGGR